MQSAPFCPSHTNLETGGLPPLARVKAVCAVFWFFVGLIMVSPSNSSTQDGEAGFMAPPASPELARAAVRAVPPLDHQIRWATTILVADTEVAGDAIFYRVQAVWKRPGVSLHVGDTLRLDTRVHELLGYRPRAGERVVFFFSGGRASNEPLEVLPVVDGRITYSPHDRSVQENPTMAELEARVAKEATAVPDVRR